MRLRRGSEYRGWFGYGPGDLELPDGDTTDQVKTTVRYMFRVPTYRWFRSIRSDSRLRKRRVGPVIVRHLLLTL